MKTFTEISNETELMRYLEDSGWRKWFPSKYRLIGFNYPVKGCVSQETIGLADIAFKIGKTTYLVEIKWEDKIATSFWPSLKVIGYVKSMNLWKQESLYRPVIMIPKEHISYDFLPILYHLGCGYISFNLNEEYLELDINIDHTKDSFI